MLRNPLLTAHQEAKPGNRKAHDALLEIARQWRRGACVRVRGAFLTGEAVREFVKTPLTRCTRPEM